jgi:hypothetical protein
MLMLDVSFQVDKNRFGRADLPVLPFDDCSVEDVADNNCHFAVGQRMSTTGGAYRFQGSIYSVLINPTGRVSPDAGEHVLFLFGLFVLLTF